MPILRPHAAQSRVRQPKGNGCERWPIRPIMGFWGDSLFWTPMNRRAKFIICFFLFFVSLYLLYVFFSCLLPINLVNQVD